MSPRGPISQLLERELEQEIRQHGIVLWLDAGGTYTRFVDGLATRAERGEFSCPVLGFRSSYLDLLLRLEGHTDGLDPESLLIHLPQHGEELVRQTPLLELYRAGYRYRQALPTLVRKAVVGLVGPTELEAFLQDAGDDLTLEKAEDWLSEATRPERGELERYLDGLNLEWIIDGLLDPDSEFSRHLKPDNALPILRDWLYRHIGLDDAFLTLVQNAVRTARDMADAVVAWLLCVEYVHDLRRPPHMEVLQPLLLLSAPIRKRCEALTRHLRERHPADYERVADQVESLLMDDLSHTTAHDLGRIDTFRYEDMRVLEAAVESLAAGRWDEAFAWASQRDARSFWLHHDTARRMAWALVRQGAELGRSIQADPGLGAVVVKGGGLKKAANLREALERYAATACRVDFAHRHFEQERLKNLGHRLPHFARLLEAADTIRECWRSWADRLAKDFNALCVEHGFLPEPDLQQRTLYEQVVHPLLQAPSTASVKRAQDGGQAETRVAYILVDAFRYEMALDLMSELEEPGSTVTLSARYAELPTITAVGMNALAPVAHGGRLSLAGDGVFTGFRMGEYIVRTPDDRARAMGTSSLDPSSKRKRWQLLKLRELCNTSPDQVKKNLKDSRLIVVHSQEIDDAGEANVGLATFETWLSQLKTAFQHLKAAGVTEFVVTADHGFLLQDQTTRERRYGNARDPRRRHVLSADRREEEGLVTVSLGELGYEGASGFLLFQDDTSAFVTGNPGATFVHGGNSLQERVIPVLRVTRQRKGTGLSEFYRIEAEALPDVMGHARMRARVVNVQPMLGRVSPPALDVAFRVPDRADIRVLVKMVHGGAHLVNQTVRMEADSEWAEVLFALEGARDERAQVEIYHPDAVHKTDPVVLTSFFQVHHTVGGVSSDDEASPPGQPGKPQHDWKDAFEDAAVLSVFTHLLEHGSITEPELAGKLGSPRRARRFALDFDSYLAMIPFSVRVEVAASGKRYVKHEA